MVAAIRLTRQYVDALGPGDGKARVTRQYIDALYGAAGKARITQQYVEVLGSALEGQEYPVSVTSTLAFTDTIVAGLDRYATYTDTIEFTEQIGVTQVHFVGSTLELSDSATAVRDIPRTVVDTLDFVETNEWHGPHYFYERNFINFEQIPYGHLAVINVWVNDTLEFTEKRGRTIYITVSDWLNLAAVGIKKDAIKHTLTFTETIVAGKSKAITTTMTLTPILHVTGLFHRQITDDLGLVHAAAYQATGSACLNRQYQPQLGFTTDTTVSVPTAVAPTLSDGTLTLTFPYVSPTTTLVLRNPQFNNKDTLNFNRINRTTRGGALVVFADPQWPKTQTLAFEVRSLTQSQAANLLEFFDDCLGLEIGLLDHEGRQWRGIITNPEEPIVNPEQGDYSTTFQFEGVLC
jgi:hypothetical protein